MTRRCFLFDLDGTLADATHRLHHIQKRPKDWDAFFAAMADDPLIEHVADVLLGIACGTDASIVYVSGRPDNYREVSEGWLFRHTLPSGPLYMRRAGDHRDDDIIKLELLARIREDGYEPIMAFDDRGRVVRAFRKAGIPVAQVAEGEF